MLPSQANLRSEREQEINDNQPLCGDALTDHDFTATVRITDENNYLQYVGGDSDLLIRLLRMWTGSYAECNWCACTFRIEE